MMKRFLQLILLLTLAASASAQLTSGKFSGPFVYIANDAGTGTAANQLVKLVATSPITAVKTLAGDTDAFGICITNCGTTGTAMIVQIGHAQCTFDGSTTAGDFVIISTTTAGNCHDTGTTRPYRAKLIGVVTTTNVGAGTYPVILYGIGTQGSLQGAASPTGQFVRDDATFGQIAFPLQSSADGSSTNPAYTFNLHPELGLSAKLSNRQYPILQVVVSGTTITITLPNPTTSNPISWAANDTFQLANLPATPTDLTSLNGVDFVLTSRVNNGTTSDLTFTAAVHPADGTYAVSQGYASNYVLYLTGNTTLFNRLVSSSSNPAQSGSLALAGSDRIKARDGSQTSGTDVTLLSKWTGTGETRRAVLGDPEGGWGAIVPGNLEVTGDLVLSSSNPTQISGVKQAATTVTVPSLKDFSLFTGSDNTLHCQLSVALGGGDCFPSAGAGAVTTAVTLTTDNIVTGNANNATVKDSAVAIGNVVTAASNYAGAGNLVQAAGASKATSDSGIVAANVVTAASNFVNANLIQGAGANKTSSDSGIATANVTTAASNYAAGDRVIAAGANKTTKSVPNELHFVLTGSGASQLLQDTDDQPTIYVNHSGGNMTIAQVWCETDSATTLTMQLQKDDGAPANMLSSNLSCSTTEANTTTFVSGENVVADGNRVDFLVVSAGGGAHWIAMHWKVTY